MRVHRVSDSSGLVANSIPKEKLVFRSHFSDQMDGAVMSFEKLLDLDVQSAVASDTPCFREIQQLGQFISIIPGLTMLASMFSNASIGGHGEDKNCGSIFKKFPLLFAAVFYPIVFKLFSRLHPPLQWRGGMIKTFQKQRFVCQ